MRALHLERDDRALVTRIADDADRVELAQPLVRVFDQLGLVGADALLADRGDVVERGP
jgi:hypothetical protein